MLPVVCHCTQARVDRARFMIESDSDTSPSLNRKVFGGVYQYFTEAESIEVLRAATNDLVKIFRLTVRQSLHSRATLMTCMPETCRKYSYNTFLTPSQLHLHTMHTHRHMIVVTLTPHLHITHTPHHTCILPSHHHTCTSPSHPPHLHITLTPTTPAHHPHLTPYHTLYVVAQP